MSEPSSQKPTFEQSLAELERIVHELEDGQLGLEEALSRYAAGVGLIKGCYAQLQAAEQRILHLTGMDADGKPVTRQFEHNATGETPKPPTRPRQKEPDADERDILF